MNLTDTKIVNKKEHCRDEDTSTDKHKNDNAEKGSSEEEYTSKTRMRW